MSTKNEYIKFLTEVDSCVEQVFLEAKMGPLVSKTMASIKNLAKNPKNIKKINPKVEEGKVEKKFGPEFKRIRSLIAKRFSASTKYNKVTSGILGFGIASYVFAKVKDPKERKIAALVMTESMLNIEKKKAGFSLSFVIMLLVLNGATGYLVWMISYFKGIDEGINIEIKSNEVSELIQNANEEIKQMELETERIEELKDMFSDDFLGHVTYLWKSLTGDIENIGKYIETGSF